MRYAFYNSLLLSVEILIHVDDSDDSTTVQFSELLKSYDCIQHVTSSTHSHDHTLDLVISNTENTVLAVHGLLSDHSLVTFNVNISKPRHQTVWAERRKWKELSTFESDLNKSKLVTGLDQLASLSVDDLAEVYDSELVSLIDKHCPVVKTRCRACM